MTKRRLVAALQGASFVRRLAVLLGAPLLGAAAAFGAFSTWVLPAIGLGEVERIRQLGMHLDRPLDARPTMAVLGDSVVLEGIDADIVEEAAPSGWSVENLSLSGCLLTEQAVLLPKLLQARPRGVAITINPVTLGTTGDLNADKACAYALGGFTNAWPAGRTRDDIPDLSAATEAALRSTRLEQSLHFRTAPLQALNLRLRDAARDDLDGGVDADWRSPNVMRADFTPERMDWHYDSLVKTIEGYPEDELDKSLALLEAMVGDIRTAGAIAVIVVEPIHPGLRRHLAALRPRIDSALGQLELRGEATAIDAWELLDAVDYADMVHPNATGRAKYSTLVGRGLPPLDAASPGRLATGDRAAPRRN